MKSFLCALRSLACSLFLCAFASSYAYALPAIQPGLKLLTGSTSQLYQTHDYDDDDNVYSYGADDYSDNDNDDYRSYRRNWRRNFSRQDFCYKCYQQCNYGPCPTYCREWGEQCQQWQWQGKVR